MVPRVLVSGPAMMLAMTLASAAAPADNGFIGATLLGAQKR